VSHNKKYANREWKGLVLSQELATFLSPLKLEIALIHMQYNSQTGIKYRGNPMENWHDWAMVQYNNNVIMCQFLCFLDVIDAKEVLSMALDDIDERGMYAIVHFVDQNVFDRKPTKPLYGTVHNKGHAFCVDQNCMLVTGWAKHTNMIDGPMLPVQHVPPPTMAAIKVSQIVGPCIGIADQQSLVPHSYLFLPPKTMWADMLCHKIKELKPALYKEVTQQIVNGISKRKQER